MKRLLYDCLDLRATTELDPNRTLTGYIVARIVGDCRRTLKWRRWRLTGMTEQPSFDIRFEESRSHLTAHLSGTYSLAGMLRAIDMMAEECHKRHAERLAIDVSISGDAPLADRYAYVRHAASVLSYLKKCAAYAGPEQRVEPFTEIVAQNRGFSLRVFGNRQEALAWLVIDS